MLVQFPNVFEESGSRWPIGRLVVLLNEHFPPPDWQDRRVEDAKNRLQRWIGRLMRINGFDMIDLEAFFACAARKVERADFTQPTLRPVRDVQHRREEP